MSADLSAKIETEGACGTYILSRMWLLHCAGFLAQDMTSGVYHVAGCNLHQYPRQTRVKAARQNLVLGAGEMERTQGRGHSIPNLGLEMGWSDACAVGLGLGPGVWR